MTQKALAEKTVRKYGTRDPFRIAEAMGFIVLPVPLKGVRGFYQYVHRCHIIYLDETLPDDERRWVCAHELGHALQHKGYNRIFMDTRTNMVSSRYEKEADRFAVDLLYSDDDLRELAEHSIDVVANCLNVSYELAEYRMSSVPTLEQC